MNLDRTKRLLEIIDLLQKGTGYDATSLAHACGVTRRTVFRDLTVLRRLGYQIEFDENCGRYRLFGTQYLPATHFSLEEALSMIVLCHEVGGRRPLPFLSAARQAAVKLESMLPQSMREKLQGMTDLVRIRLQPTNDLEGQEPFYQRLCQASAQKRCVRILYQTPTEEGTIRTRLSPYRLLFSRRSWYAIGRSSLHRSVRTFNLGRILGMEELEDRYSIPRGFSLKRYLRNAWHLIPESGPDQEIVIRFAPMVAQNVAEIGWHPTQRCEFTDDGSLLFRVTVSGLHEISWWVLGYGDKAEVLQPAELRRIVAGHAVRMARLYHGAPTDTEGF